MDIKAFLARYKEAFGESAPLPIAFGYGNKAVVVDCVVPRCMIGAISKVRDGRPLTLCAENVICGGGGLYTGFAPMQERIPHFVADIEHYKRTARMVEEYIAGMKILPASKPYLNFERLDQVENLDEVEALLFWATPDILSGLASWAFYDNNADDAVMTLFGSGCASIITRAVRENREGGRRCFIGMLDPSARLLVPANELTFVIPLSRFREMADTMADSALFQHAFSVVKKRIAKNLE